MAKLNPPVYWKFAVVGSTSEATPEVRARILGAVEEALKDLDGVKVDNMFFQFHDVKIRFVKPEVSDGE